MKRIARLRAPVWAAVLTTVVAAGAASAQSPVQEWGFDPSVLVADGRDLLQRAPDPAVDGLFQAVHATAQDPADAGVMCALFDPAADRSLQGLNDTAARLGEQSRLRFADAAVDVFVAAAQSPPQPFDRAQATQWLKAAGVRASLLHDGFVAGLNGGDHGARCNSVGALLEVLHDRPLTERAAVTRLLLGEGLVWMQGERGSLPIER
ncbi:hypothetical protein [Lysobacter sp. A3-1-A15]|uniref:hypothetical protein n=1 Tax=Novilysobacter viscosus TaxID=3098602 RepID=UPI002ED910F2